VLPLFDNIPTRRFPVVTVSLIAANFAVWFWELGARDQRITEYAFYPCAVRGPCTAQAAGHVPWPEGVLTSMFMHASWLHILVNMLFLWIFGNNVEDALGRVRYLVFYIAAGFVAALTQAAVTIMASGVSAASVPTLGASGAIAGVLGAYIVILPRARVVTLLFGFLPVPLPAIVVLGFWFIYQLVDGGASLTQPQGGGGVAFFAHVGGFAFGVLAVTLLHVRAPLQPQTRR
jgi:membrane associated rhomboid family serine protease